MSPAFIYAGAALLIIIILIAAVDYFGIFENDEEETGDGTDRVKEAARRQRDSLSIFQKPKQLAWPGKVVIAASFLLGLGAMVWLYFTLRTGTPAQVPYANALRTGAITLGAMTVGVAYSSKRLEGRGKLEIIYEDVDGHDKDAEIIYFTPEKTHTNQDSNPVVYEEFKTRILFLFTQFKLVAHDPDLRSEGYPLTSVVRHEIPDHAVEIKPHHYVVQTQGRDTANISDAAHYTYKAGKNPPYSVVQRLQERARSYERQVGFLQSRLAEVEEQLLDVQRRLQTREEYNKRNAREEISDTLEMLPSKNQNIELKQDRTPARSNGAGPDSQKDVVKNRGDN